MSSFSFSLGPKLADNLLVPGGGNGVYQYAIAYSGGDYVSSITLISDGVQTATQSLDVTPPFVSGNVVVITQQTAGTSIAPLVPSSLAWTDITAAYASTNNFRYDMIEATINGNASDAADLTNIVQFGNPMSISVTIAGETTTRGYVGSVGTAMTPTGQYIYTTIDGLSPSGFQDGVWTTGSTPLTDPRLTYMEGNNGNAAGSGNLLNNPAYWTDYVTNFVKSHQLDGARIANFFPGVTDSSGAYTTPPYFLYYEIKYADGFIQLNPIDVNGFNSLLTSSGTGVQAMSSAIKMPITAAFATAPYASNSALTESIFVQLGDLYIFADPSNTSGAPSTTQPMGTNNQFAAPLKYLLGGFEAGFWGGSALSIPDAVTSTPHAVALDLNQTWNWSTLYAYEAVGSGSALADFDYHNSVTGAASDPYAKTIFANSNAYGWSYSDFLALLGGAVNPTLSVYDPSNPNGIQINVTLFDNSDTPTGFTETSLSNFYLTPTNAALTTAPAPTVPQLIVDTAVGIPGTTQLLAPADGTPMKLRLYTGGAWVEAALPSDYHQIFNVALSGTTLTLTAAGDSGLPGKILFSGMPVPPSGDTTWYQVVVGSGMAAKTFNFYAVWNGTQFTTVAADGGAQAIGNSAIAQLNLSQGGSITYDPSYWLTGDHSPPAPPPQTMSAPLVGEFSGGTFNPLTADLSSLMRGDLAFSFDSNGANRTASFNIAEIRISDAANPTWIYAPVVSHANADGDWIMPLGSQFGNGTYSAFMQQYVASDWSLANPTGYATIDVNFSVNLDTLMLGAASGGTSLALTQGSSSTEGNWIALHATGSTLPNGTLVAYATNGLGQMLARDGTVTGSIDDAAMAKIGMVKADNGSLFYSGDQSVYLAVGNELKFAIVTGNGVVDAAPLVNVTGSGTLGVAVNGSAGSFSLTATVDNTLSQSAILASGQRASDHAWVYLEQGSSVKVDQAWSGSYVNTLHFVRVDVDPSNPTEMKVGGVAYGNTDAFRAAVQINWEAFSSSQGNSTGSASANWTVGGGTGYYMPVLVTPDGMWMINDTPGSTANVDGAQHIRVFGQNTFGFEDMSAAKGADFDYNDMVVKLTLLV